MSETLFSELLKQGFAVAILSLIGWTLWKRYDARMKETTTELKELRARFETEYSDDRLEMKLIIKETNEMNSKMVDSVNRFSEFIQKQNEVTKKTLDRNSSVMECLTAQIKVFKQQQKQTA
jgi:hypothetical protein